RPSAALAPQRALLRRRDDGDARGDRATRFRGVPRSVFLTLCRIIRGDSARPTPCAPGGSGSMTFPPAELMLAGAGPPGGAGGNAVLTQVVFFAAIFAVFYFLLIRPQQTQRRERERLLSAIKRGDRVVTTGGLHGTITGLDETTATLRVADQVKVTVDRSAIGRVVEAQGEKDA